MSFATFVPSYDASKATFSADWKTVSAGTMFGRRYFGLRYYGADYFGPADPILPYRIFSRNGVSWTFINSWDTKVINTLAEVNKISTS
jgi:hypothetical protein